MLLAITAPVTTDHGDHRLLDGLVDRLGRALVALGTRMTRASTPAPRTERVAAYRAAEARRRADEHMRDNAAQVNPLGLR